MHTVDPPVNVPQFKVHSFSCTYNPGIRFLSSSNFPVCSSPKKPANHSPTIPFSYQFESDPW